MRELYHLRLRISGAVMRLAIWIAPPVQDMRRAGEVANVAGGAPQLFIPGINTATQLDEARAARLRLVERTGKQPPRWL